MTKYLFPKIMKFINNASDSMNDSGNREKYCQNYAMEQGFYFTFSWTLELIFFIFFNFIKLLYQHKKTNRSDYLSRKISTGLNPLKQDNNFFNCNKIKLKICYAFQYISQKM